MHVQYTEQEGVKVLACSHGYSQANGYSHIYSEISIYIYIFVYLHINIYVCKSVHF